MEVKILNLKDTKNYKAFNKKFHLHVKAWFDGLDRKTRLNITKACRWYAYHNDSYLNSAYRNKPFPKSKLIRHAEDIENYEYDCLYNEIDNPDCNRALESPFQKFIGVDRILLSEYIEKINDSSSFIHEVFTTHYCILTEDITVYRGLCVNKGSTLLTAITGATSVSLNLAQAYHFSTSVYTKDEFGNDMEYDSEIYDSFIIEFKIQAGTRYIPMNVCTLQNEHEIVIIDQGRINVLTEKMCVGSHKKGVIIHTLIKYYEAEFINFGILPVYREISIDYEHERESKIIDDI